MLKTLSVIAALIVLAVAPFVAGSYYLDLLTTIAIYSILLLGLDICFIASFTLVGSTPRFWANRFSSCSARC